MTAELELLKHMSSEVTEHTYLFKDETGVFVYKEWLDSCGRCMDSVLRDKSGYEIDDPALLERVWEAVDKIENNK